MKIAAVYWVGLVCPARWWTKTERLLSLWGDRIRSSVWAGIYLFYFNWRIIALLYCVGFRHTSTWISHRYTYVPSLLSFPPLPTSLGCHTAPDWSSLHNTALSPWLPVLHVVVVFPWYSPHSSHPLTHCVHKSVSMSASPLLDEWIKLWDIYTQ